MPSNPIEEYKKEGNGLDIIQDIPELARSHSGWETMEPAERERLKWIGAIFCQPSPGNFTMRVRVTGGQASSAQLRLLAALSRRLGNGVLDITTRQQIELRAVKINNMPEILDALAGVDLTSLQTSMDNVRNVTCCPLAGLTEKELFDASSIGYDFTRVFLGNKELSNLPRKFNATITGCLENCTNAETQDLALTPARHFSDGAPGFNVSVGGKMGGSIKMAQPLDVFVEPHKAVRLASDVLSIFRDEGFRDQRTRGRLAFLIDSWGIPRFRDTLQKRCGWILENAQEDARLAHTSDHLGIQKQKQPGLVSVGLCVPTGRLSADQAEEISYLAESYGSGHIRLTTEQNAILVNVPEAKLNALLGEPLLKTFSPDPHPFFRGLVACTGTDYCKLAQIETKSIALNLAQEMSKVFPQAAPVSMRWSGCPAGCGNHQTADIGFQGVQAQINGAPAEAVNIFIGGKAGAAPKPGERIVEQLPISRLNEVVPLILQNMGILNKVRRPRAGERRILVVPTLASPVHNGADE